MQYLEVPYVYTINQNAKVHQKKNKTWIQKCGYRKYRYTKYRYTDVHIQNRYTNMDIQNIDKQNRYTDVDKENLDTQIWIQKI